MKLALIHDGIVRAEATEDDQALDVFDIRDVSAVAGIAPGWLANEDGSYEAPPVVEAPSQPIITYKADLYRRCTDAEADAIEMALAAASVRQRRLFESAQYLDHTDPVFAAMREAMEHMFGADRTAELLAAS